MRLILCILLASSIVPPIFYDYFTENWTIPMASVQFVQDGVAGLIILSLPSLARRAWKWYWKAFTVPARPVSTQPCS